MNQPTQTIGSWICPTGNRVDATLQGAGQDVTFCWDIAPPNITSEDHAYYIQVIRPQAVMRAVALFQKRMDETSPQVVLSNTNTFQ